MRSLPLPGWGEELCHPGGVGVWSRESNQDRALELLVRRQPLFNISVRSETNVHAIAIGYSRRHQLAAPKQRERLGECHEAFGLVEGDCCLVV